MNKPNLPRFAVFLKPWPAPLKEVAQKVRDWGFDGVELPVRPGFPVTPENAPAELPKAVGLFASMGLRIESVAGDPTESLIAACGQAKVPIIRICVQIPPGQSYLAEIDGLRRKYRDFVPTLDAAGVAIGIQNHCDRFLSNAMGIRHLVHEFDPRHVCAVWDAAHSALNGEDPELGLDIVWSHLRMVNLKNAYWKRKNGPEAEVAHWRPYWTLGRHGLASWPRVARELARRKSTAPLCLTAEYTDEPRVDALIREDILFARSVFESEYRDAS